MQLTTISIRRMWIIIIICFLINAPCVIMRSDNRSCVVEPGGQSFAEKIISFAEAFNNKSFSVLVQSGIYYATNGSFMNFINFKNVAITTDASGDVNIKKFFEHFNNRIKFYGVWTHYFSVIHIQ